MADSNAIYYNKDITTNIIVTTTWKQKQHDLKRLPYTINSSAYDFLGAIGEPVARPEYIHQYHLAPYILYAAVATNIHTELIIKVLSRLSKNEVPSKVIDFLPEVHG